MSAPETFIIALGQILVEGGNPQANLDRAVAAVNKASYAGCELIVFPEVLDCGWCDESAREFAQPIPEGDHFKQLLQAAIDNETAICAGLTERDGDKIYNTAVFIDYMGFLLGKHRKVNELAIGKEIYSTGKSAEVVCEMELGTLGVMICADAFFPGEALTRSLAKKGAQLILSPCAWAVPPDHDQEKSPYGDLWRDVYGRVAREHKVWIAATSNVGEIRHGAWAGHHCVGCSMVVGPDGEVREMGAYREEDLVYVTVKI